MKSKLWIGAGIKDLIQDNTKIVYVEAPGSQTFEMRDIPAIAAEAHKRGCVVIMDDTWSAGIYFKPFEHGVDVCAMAATKYIVGHSDVMMGLITTTEEQWDKVRPSAAVLGANSGPDDIYLALRGLRTLPVSLGRSPWIARTASTVLRCAVSSLRTRAPPERRSRSRSRSRSATLCAGAGSSVRWAAAAEGRGARRARTAYQTARPAWLRGPGERAQGRPCLL